MKSLNPGLMNVAFLTNYNLRSPKINGTIKNIFQGSAVIGHINNFSA